MKIVSRLMVLALLTALVMATSVSVAQDESVIVIGFEQEPPNLWPLNTLTFGGLVESFYARDLWEWDVNRQAYPVMAAEIPSLDNGLVEVNDEGNTVVTIQLREGLLWSDGTPITTADCEVWHQVRSNPATSANVGRGTYPDSVLAFEIVDELTYRMTYAGVYPDFAAVPEQPECKYPASVFGAAIADGGVLEDSPYFTQGPSVAYGPYMLTTWNTGENMIFERNPYWDGATPAWDRVIVQFVTDDTQMRNAVANGEVDMSFNWSDDLNTVYGAMDNVEIFAAPGVYSDALWIRSGANGNDESPIGDALQDPLVRQAIAHAIDRRALAEELVGPGIEVPNSWYPSVLWPADLPFLEYDVDLAVSLLEQAGWTDTNGDGTVDRNGVEFTGLRFVTTENTLRNNYQLFIQEYLNEVGIGTDIQIIPATTLFAAFADRGTLTTYAWDLAIFANSADPLTPVSDLDSYSCAGIPSAENPDGFNPWQFCNPRYDEVDQLIRNTLPGPERDALIAEAVTLKWEGFFWHGLRLRSTWFAVNSTVFDFESVSSNVGTLAADWFNQIENWQPAG